MLTASQEAANATSARIPLFICIFGFLCFKVVKMHAHFKVKLFQI